MRDILNLLNEATLVELTDDSRRDFWNDVRDHHTKDLTKPEIKNWPMSKQEFREFERQIFQDPEWMAYYARFDWKSWIRPTNYWYDKHRDVFNFYYVPSIWYMNGDLTPDRTMLRIKTNGEILPHTEYPENSVILPSAIDVCMDVVRSAAPKMRYLRGTYYIRFGKWPKDERSRNWAIKDYEHYEDGVSVFHADYDVDEGRWAIDPSVHEETINGTMSALIYGTRDVFLVQGDEQKREGSDGEPVLRNVRLVEKLPIDQVYVPGIFDPREDMD